MYCSDCTVFAASFQFIFSAGLHFPVLYPMLSVSRQGYGTAGMQPSAGRDDRGIGQLRLAGFFLLMP